MKRKYLDYKEKRFVNYCEQYYFRWNGFPTPEQAATALSFNLPQIQVFLLSKKVQAALERRGLPWKVSGATASTELSSLQLAVAMSVVNFADERPISKKLDELGCSVTQYYAWLDDPSFREFVQRRADSNLSNIRPEAVTEFAKLIRRGDFSAIKYYFDSTGEFTSQSIEDIRTLLQLVIESIQRHVKEPEVLAAISRDLLNVAPTISTGVSFNSQYNSNYSNVLTERGV